MREKYEVIKLTEEDFRIDVSRFHYLEPIGIKTPYVESLSSYIVRLALFHNTAPSSIIKHEISDFLTSNQFNPKSNSSAKNYAAARSINGFEKAAAEWSVTISKLTKRNDINWLTLLPLEEVLSHKGLLKKHRAWCPCCLEEFKDKGLREEEDPVKQKLAIYEPLLWKLNDVRICPVHKVKLVKSCSKCGKENNNIAPKMLAGHCSVCCYWLGETLYSPLEDDKIAEEIWNTNAICEVLAATPTMEILPTKENISSFMSYLLENRIKGGVREFGELVKIPHQYICDWIDGSNVPMLKNLLQICWYFQIPLINALCFTHGDVLDLGIQTSSGGTSSVVKPQNPINWPKIEEELVQMASGELPPKEIQSLAVEHNCHVSNFYRVHPELCKQVSDRMRAQASQERAIYNQKLKERMVQIVADSKESNLPLRKIDVYKMLGGHSLKKKSLLKDVYNEMGM